MADYSEDFIDRLHLIWGAGFLSPGGPEEVADIVKGLDLNNSLVLDIGCGTGGPAIVLAKNMGAKLVCIDVEPQLIERAKKLAVQAGITDQIDFQLVEPGRLPFEADTFDVVFSKDALIHIPGKKALYAEILRVLKPGGAFAASDWLSGDDAAEDQEFQDFLKLIHLDFTMATVKETAEVMHTAGFYKVETKDRNAWYVEQSAEELSQIEGPLREQIIEVSSPQIYENWLAVRRQLAAVTKSGALRPTHLRGFRPAD